MKMDLSFLGEEIYCAIKQLDFSRIYEIRLRVGFAVKVYYNGKFDYLYLVGENAERGKVYCTEKTISDILFCITEGSVYAFNDEIKDGFITYKGQRVGIAGEFVYMDEKIKTIKKVDSLCIRFSHEVDGCSAQIFNYIVNRNCIYNSLIISPKRRGKTTILKDLAVKLSKQNHNVLIVDERAEFTAVFGENVDKYVKAKKTDTIPLAIRSFSPDVIITDELSGIDEFYCVKDAVLSGVSVIASCHGEDVIDVRNKSSFIGGVFDRYLVLNGAGAEGRLSKVYDKEYNLI